MSHLQNRSMVIEIAVVFSWRRGSSLLLTVIKHGTSIVVVRLKSSLANPSLNA